MGVTVVDCIVLRLFASDKPLAIDVLMQLADTLAELPMRCVVRVGALWTVLAPECCQMEVLKRVEALAEQLHHARWTAGETIRSATGLVQDRLERLDSTYITCSACIERIARTKRLLSNFYHWWFGLIHCESIAQGGIRGSWPRADHGSWLRLYPNDSACAVWDWSERSDAVAMGAALAALSSKIAQFPCRTLVRDVGVAVRAPSECQAAILQDMLETAKEVRRSAGVEVGGLAEAEVRSFHEVARFVRERLARVDWGFVSCQWCEARVVEILQVFDAYEARLDVHEAWIRWRSNSWNLCRARELDRWPSVCPDRMSVVLDSVHLGPQPTPRPMRCSWVPHRGPGRLAVSRSSSMYLHLRTEPRIRGPDTSR